MKIALEASERREQNQPCKGSEGKWKGREGEWGSGKGRKDRWGKMGLPFPVSLKGPMCIYYISPLSSILTVTSINLR